MLDAARVMWSFRELLPLSQAMVGQDLLFLIARMGRGFKEVLAAAIKEEL